LLDGGEVDLATLFSATEFSESDVKAAMDKYSIDEPTAITIVTARRARVANSESADLHKLAKLMGFELLDAEQFVARFGKRANKTVDTE
jgi:hypothetical protein